MKFIGYVYLPKDEDISMLSDTELLKLISYHKEHRNGRLKIYDDYNENTITARDIHFDDWSQLISHLEGEYRKRSNERLKLFFRRLFRKFK